MYDSFCSSVERQRGLYIRLVQQCRARFSPGTGSAGSAKPSGEAAERSHLTLPRVLTAFILCRVSIFYALPWRQGTQHRVLLQK